MEFVSESVHSNPSGSIKVMEEHDVFISLDVNMKDFIEPKCIIHSPSEPRGIEWSPDDDGHCKYKIEQIAVENTGMWFISGIDRDRLVNLTANVIVDVLG
jgi:hypothetical protein